jgi:hypothetical protein
MEISFLYPYALSALYVYPAVPHILQLPQLAVIAKVSHNTAAGHTYTLTSEKTKLTTEGSKMYIYNLH